MRLTTTRNLAVNPRCTTHRIESYTVTMRYTMCRIYDSMRYVVVFRRETVVLQVSKKLYKIKLHHLWTIPNLKMECNKIPLVLEWTSLISVSDFFLSVIPRERKTIVLRKPFPKSVICTPNTMKKGTKRFLRYKSLGWCCVRVIQVRVCEKKVLDQEDVMHLSWPLTDHCLGRKYIYEVLWL